MRAGATTVRRATTCKRSVYRISWALVHPAHARALFPFFKTGGILWALLALQVLLLQIGAQTFPSISFVNLYVSNDNKYGSNSQSITLKNPQPTYTNVTFSQVRACLPLAYLAINCHVSRHTRLSAWCLPSSRICTTQPAVAGTQFVATQGNNVGGQKRCFHYRKKIRELETPTLLPPPPPPPSPFTQ